MDRQAIHNLLRLLKATSIRDHGKWITASCPFAPYLHEDKKDEHPSFGIAVDDFSSYHCFACGKKGRVQMLPAVLAHYGKGNTVELRRLISQSESVFTSNAEIEKKKLVYLDEKILNKFEPLETNFGSINLKSIKLWGLRYDPGESRVIFPIRDKTGKLVAVRGRFTGQGGMRYRTYSELTTGIDSKAHGIWFGEHFIRDPNRLLVLVEGERDAVLLKQEGIHNVWCAMGASITQPQLEALLTVKNPILCFFDDDSGGRQAAAAVSSRLKGLKKVVTVTEFFGAKDPAEAVEEKVLAKIRKAVLKYF